MCYENYSIIILYLIQLFQVICYLKPRSIFILKLDLEGHASNESYVFKTICKLKL